MLKKIYFTAIAIMVVMIGFQSCDSDDTDSRTARVQLKLVDLPGDYLEVNVNIIDVQYNNSEDEEGWRSFESFEGAQLVNLTELVGGVNLVLSNEIIPAGTLKQIRLVLGDGNTVKIEGEIEGEGETFSLDTPSAQQSGLKLNLNEELEAGFSYTFILDWDVQKSIVKTGSDKYILKPVIRVEAETNSGSIEGVVTGAKTDDGVEGAVQLNNVVVELYKSGANEGDEPIATTTTNEEGYFIFEGLPPTNYEIEIEIEGYVKFELEDITVIVGEIKDAGSIELIVF
ncbi:MULTISPECIES: DUF4382 domain-containing protein [Flavobacteriaceae]|uniref:DUF4382 domain-containing protein n=2 Tax=Flavobacteriaceae TaxID=49546 RepID=A0A4Y8AQH8_9FLAO|nr:MULTISPECIES: DUF4382 domain-containing protein [Flavobacteriaceae]TEW72205.1 DUF4382 domain-containing protein [Gramella jeungdoensis]GGK57181.1 hypothetical protein GCM10007963_26810 [Lutibacter litoralis]